MFMSCNNLGEAANKSELGFSSKLSLSLSPHLSPLSLSDSQAVCSV